MVKGDRIGTLARSRGSATPSVTQTNQPPTTFSQPCLGQGRSYRDAGPVEGQRYPFGNPNQSATPRHFHSLVLVKGDRIGTLARSRGSATPSVTQTNQPPTTFSQPCLGQGRSYRDAGPVEGQRYPFGNPNQSSTPTTFSQPCLGQGRVVSDAGPVEGQRSSVTQTNQPPPRPFLGHRRVVSGRWPGRGAALTPTALCRWFPRWQTRIADKGCQTPAKKHVGTLARSRGNGTPTVTQTNL